MNTFVYFTELPEDLKRNVYSHVQNPRDYLALSVSFKKDMFSKQEKLQHIKVINNMSLEQLTNILVNFQNSSLSFNETFRTNKEIREKYFNLFVHGYQGMEFIRDDKQRRNFISEFGDLVSHIAHRNNMFNFIFDKFETIRISMEISDSLRICKTYHENGMNYLFGEVYEDCLFSDTLQIEYESGVIININEEICLSTENNKEWITVHVSIDDTLKKLTKIKKQFSYDIAFEEEHSGEWIEKSKEGWIIKLIESIQSILKEKHVLGNIKHIKCCGDSEISWRQAYFELDVQTNLRNMT